MKTVFARLFVTCLLAVGPIAHADPEPVKIGFLPPLTGLEASEGVVHRKALDLAVKQVNAAGGIKGRPVQLVVVDNKSTPQGALEAYDQLVEKEKVFAIIGSIKSAQIVAMIPRALQTEVPMVIGGTATRLTETGVKWFFRTRPSDAITSKAMVKYVKESTPYTKVAIINDTSAFGTGGANLVAKAVADTGLKLVKRETFAPGDTSRFAPIVKSVDDAGAEVAFVYVGTNDDQGKLMVVRKEAGAKFVYLGSPSGASKPALAIAKDAAEGNLAVMDFVLGQTDPSRKYAEEYRREYGEDADPQSVYAYDGMKIFAKAMNDVGVDRAKVRDYILHKLKDYPGVIGTYVFDSRGDGLGEVSVVRIEKGKPKLLKVVSTR